MKRTYRGSCHCKAVTFEVDLDLAKGTGRCNCTWCTKARNWGARAEPGGFRLLTGEGELADYSRFPQMHHRFCRRCGVHTHAHGDIPEIGGAFVSVQVATLDGVEAGELLQTPIHYSDGLHDNWWNSPPETRHL